MKSFPAIFLQIAHTLWYPAGEMSSNAQTLFSEISKALHRAGLFISYADLTGGEESRKAEMQALSFLVLLLQKQNSEGSFLHDLAKLASGEFQDFDHSAPCSEENLKTIQKDLQNVPLEIGDAFKSVLENFSKPEARLYADILISVGASVAQAYDEKDDFFLASNRFTDTMFSLGNFQPFFHRTLMFFSNIYADKEAKHLYENDNIFDEMKISTKESDALGQLTNALRKAWLEKYPGDIQQTVQDYIRENNGAC